MESEKIHIAHGIVKVAASGLSIEDADILPLNLPPWAQYAGNAPIVLIRASSVEDLMRVVVDWWHVDKKDAEDSTIANAFCATLVAKMQHLSGVAFVVRCIGVMYVGWQDQQRQWSRA